MELCFYSIEGLKLYLKKIYQTFHPFKSIGGYEMHIIFDLEDNIIYQIL